MSISTVMRLFVCFVILWTTPVYSADAYKATQKFYPTMPGDPQYKDGFGQTVKVHNNFLFVAAPLARHKGKLAEGVVYVYQNDGKKWVNAQILSVGGLAEGLGVMQIDVQDNWLLISSRCTPVAPVPNQMGGNQDFTGAIHIYRLNRNIEEGTQRWNYVQTLDYHTPGLEDLTPSSPEGFDPAHPTVTAQQGASFGLQFNFDLKNKLLLVGAPYQEGVDDHGNPVINAGAVYAFKMKSDGHFEILHKFTNPDGMVANDTFGSNVRIQGHYALISNAAIHKTPRLHSNSTVYVYHFRKNAWHLIQRLHGDQLKPTKIHSPVLGDVSVGDGFGSSLAIDDRWAIIGAGFESKGADKPLSGAVYFYKRMQVNNQERFVRKQKIISNDPHAQGTGLFHIDLQDGVALIGDPLRSGPKGHHQGGILVCKRSGGKWKIAKTLFDPRGVPYGFFGCGVSYDGKLIAGGTGSFAKSYLFKLVGNPTIEVPLPLEKGKVILFKAK